MHQAASSSCPPPVSNSDGDAAAARQPASGAMAGIVPDVTGIAIARWKRASV